MAAAALVVGDVDLGDRVLALTAARDELDLGARLVDRRDDDAATRERIWRETLPGVSNRHVSGASIA